MKFLGEKFNFFLVHLVVTIGTLSISLLIYNLHINEEKALEFVSLLTLALFIWQLYSWKKITGKLFGPYILFLIASTIFNTGQVIVYVLTGFTEPILKNEFSFSTLLSTIQLIIISHNLMHLGAIISYLTTNKKIVKGKDNKVNKVNVNRLVNTSYYIGVTFLIISIVPTLTYFYNSFRIVLSSGYFGLYQQEVLIGFDAISSIIRLFIIPAAIFILIGSKNNINEISKKRIILALLIIIFYSGSFLLLGKRAQAILPLMAFFWVWDIYIKKINRTLLLSISSFLFFILFPIIAIIRGASGSNKFSINNAFETFTNIDNPLTAILSELGSTMSSLAYVLIYIPETREFDLGSSYFYAFTTFFPNLFWDIHPAVLNGKYANWLIWQVDPHIAKAGGGIGFSYIAEAFANFGYIGTPFVLFILGFLIVKVEKWALKKGNPVRIGLVGVLIAFFLFYVRDESASILRNLLWYGYIPYLVIQFFSKISKKN